MILFLTFAEFSPTKNCNSDYNEYFSKKFAMQENVDLFSCFDIFTSWHTYARKSFTPYFKSSYSLLYTHYSILPVPRPNTSYPLLSTYYSMPPYYSIPTFLLLTSHNCISTIPSPQVLENGLILVGLYSLPSTYSPLITIRIYHQIYSPLKTHLVFWRFFYKIFTLRFQTNIFF